MSLPLPFTREIRGPWLPIGQETVVGDDLLVLCMCIHCGRTRSRYNSELEKSKEYGRCDFDCEKEEKDELARKTSRKLRFRYRP